MTDDQEQVERVILRELAEIRVMVERIHETLTPGQKAVREERVDFLYLALCRKAGIEALGKHDTGLPETKVPM